MSRMEKRRRLKFKDVRPLIICLALVIIGTYILACASVKSERILSKTKVNDTDVGGMTVQEAERQIKGDFKEKFTGKVLKISLDSQEYELKLIDCVTMDAEKAAQKAYQFGHGSFLSRGLNLIRAVTLGKTYKVIPELKSENILEEQLKDTGILDAVTTVQTSYEMTDEAIIFTKGTTGGKVEEDKLCQAIKDAIASEDYDTVIEAPMKEVAVEETNMEELYKKIHKVMSNATLDPKNDYAIVKSVTGIDFDPKEAQVTFNEAKEGSTVLIPISVDKPKVSTDQLKKHLFKDRMGSCTLEVQYSSARVNNIKKAVKKLSGKVILAGEEFSFNKTTGKRNSDTGYREASASLDGAKDNETASGVCQVAAALYYATVTANLDVTEHHIHTYTASYLKPGQDCAVNGKADYKFKNNTDYPIRIYAKYNEDEGKLTVRIYGAKLDDNTVKFTSKVSKKKSYSTEYIKDDDRYEGDDYIQQEGKDGCTVQTYRNIYDKNGKKISSKKEDSGTYESKTQIIVKGTMVYVPPTTQAPTTETKPTTDSSGKKSGASTSKNATSSGNNGKSTKKKQ